MTSADDPSASLEQQVDITLKGKEQRLMLMQKLMQRRQPASRILVLRNMVGPEDVDEELENEITDECGKFGEVERVIIYQEKQGEEEDADVIVKIFVEFVNAKSLEKATESLNGRFFAGRVVKAEVYDQTSYDSKDYSG
jgi:poly(U)-binding-splicing factor PUF60